MNQLIRFLFNTNRPLWRYCLLTTSLVVISAWALMNLVLLGFRIAHIDPARHTPSGSLSSTIDAVGVIAIAPIVETFLLALLIAILSSFITSKLWVAITSGVLWGLGHALFGLLWFFVPAWVFFILSCSYIAWREKSFKHAYLVALVPHIFNNATAVIAAHLSKHA